MNNLMMIIEVMIEWVTRVIPNLIVIGMATIMLMMIYTKVKGKGAVKRLITRVFTY